MINYHLARYVSALISFLALTIFLTGCLSPQISLGNFRVRIFADGQKKELDIPAGSTVEDALIQASITLGNLDRSEPPLFTVVSDGEEIKLVRVSETFETEETSIPFEHQIIRNESLPEGETRLIQPGINGLQEITTRHVFEDDVEITNTTVKTVILKTPVPEIIMVGVQAAFAPISIPGRLIYLAGGNAWLMENSTTNRRPLITTGDLDGRIFSVSPNGDWLLFTRKSNQPLDKEINTLWVISTTGAPEKLIDLKVSNVVHYAGWWPAGGNKVVFSTVEPRSTTPGWQANNDLFQVTFASGLAAKPTKIIEANSGGVYGWWGMTFAWSANGKYLGYARPDGIGLVDIDNGTLVPIIDITPLQTHSDWAWIPAIAWGSDNQTLYAVTHAPPPGLVSPEESPYFDLSGISLINSVSVPIVQQTGMFAYPSISPIQINGKEKSYQVAYLQAIFPAQSETSRYRVVVMDRDGSNRHVVFPSEDAQGLDPQTPVWAPESFEGQTGNFLALIYQGNLWLIDTATGQAQQITGDSLISRIDWK